MKIAFITTSVIPSSTANSIQAMKVVHANGLLGQTVKLWVPDFGNADWETIADIYGVNQPFDITWLPFTPSRKQYDFSWKAVRAANQWGADVIYTWSLQAAVIALLQNKPAVLELHDYPMGRLGPVLFRAFMRFSGRKLILCTTNALARGLEARFHLQFAPGELLIAPNGCDLERYANLPNPQDARRQLGLEEGFTVGYSGHFYPGRGMDLLAAIASALPGVCFLWMGGKPEDIEPWQQWLDSQHNKNVTITGFIANSKLPLYQAAADVLVMPYGRCIAGSSGGNIADVINPMKMFDYLAAGRALVASDIPVFHEVLHEGITLFCRPEQPESWVQAITRLKEDPQLRQRLAQNAKKEAARYSWTERALNTLALLEKLLK